MRFIQINIIQMNFPGKISARLSVLEHSKQMPRSTAESVAVSFCCGSFIRFFLEIEENSSVIKDASFKSNGCGYMLAAADILAEWLLGSDLTELHGLTEPVLLDQILKEFEAIVHGRRECIDSCFQSIHVALSNLRSSRIEEFAGEKALICSCFGVTEERIEAIIRLGNIETVDDISEECNAGLGCGSCRMMIQEMIDNA